MADFLTRLAQRTLGLAPVVQPRIASRYVPAAEVMMATPLEQFAATEPSTEASDVSIPPAAPQGGRPADLEPPLTRNARLIPPEPFPKTILHSDSETSSSETKNTSLIDQTEPSFPSSLEQSRNDSKYLPSPSQSASPANSSVDSVKSFPLLPQQGLENRVISPTDQIAQSVEPHPLNSSPSFREPSPPLYQSLQQSEQTPQVRSVNLPLVPPAAANSSYSPLVNARKARTESSFMPESRTTSGFTSTQSSLNYFSSFVAQPNSLPEPTIEIRIGRIEVREKQPTTSKSRPKLIPSTPALSLSDYLNQRDGGKL